MELGREAEAIAQRLEIGRTHIGAKPEHDSGRCGLLSAGASSAAWWVIAKTRNNRTHDKRIVESCRLPCLLFSLLLQSNWVS